MNGRAAGVPFVLLAPAGGERADAPVVVSWHLTDPPRTAAAFASALPLTTLDAWRVYLELPMCGSRMPKGGWDAVMALGYEDAVVKLDGPMITQAVEEALPAWEAIRREHGLEPRGIGLLGGSLGAAVALTVLTEGVLDADAVVLVSPLVRLRSKVEAMSRRYNVTYTWSPESNALAERIDYVARADEIAKRPSTTDVLIVVGSEDDPGIVEPAKALASRLSDDTRFRGRSRIEVIPGMAHALSDEPGFEPAPQTTHAAAVDRIASAWLADAFDRHGQDGEHRP